MDVNQIWNYAGEVFCKDRFNRPENKYFGREETEISQEHKKVQKSSQSSSLKLRNGYQESRPQVPQLECSFNLSDLDESVNYH